MAIFFRLQVLMFIMIFSCINIYTLSGSEKGINMSPERRNRPISNTFEEMHIPGKPVVIFNAWDAGTANLLSDIGQGAVIGTSSYAIAEANGYRDGENMPFQEVLRVLKSITEKVNCPVTFDFEGGFATDQHILEKNTSCLLDTGIVGINFEDQIVHGKGLYSIPEQVRRITTVRKILDTAPAKIFLNARTDIFFQTPQEEHHTQINLALERAKAYSRAGADGFFVPGLTNPDLIKLLCSKCSLPVNIMTTDTNSSIQQFSALGVSRISMGPAFYLIMQEAIRNSTKTLLKK